MSEPIDWSAINRMVAPEHQYQDVKDPPLDPIRMAWPFKTDEERKLLGKWFKQEEKKLKKKATQEHIERYGKALI